MDGRMDGRKVVWMDGWTDDGWKVGWMEGWVDGCMDVWGNGRWLRTSSSTWLLKPTTRLPIYISWPPRPPSPGGEREGSIGKRD